MRDSAQARFNPTDDQRGLWECFTRALRVDDDRAVRALAGLGAGGVGIIATDPPVGGVVIDHRIHIAGGDAEEQARRTELREIRRVAPVGLGDDADSEPLCFKHAANNRHAKTRVIDVGVAANDHDIAGIPTQRFHFGARGGEEWRRPQAMCPELAVAENVFGRVHSRIAGG